MPIGVCFFGVGLFVEKFVAQCLERGFLSDSLTRKEMLWLLPPYEIMRKGISESAFAASVSKPTLVHLKSPTTQMIHMSLSTSTVP